MLSPKDFRSNAEEVLNWIEGYFDSLESFPVKSKVKPGDILKQLPPSAPLEGDSLSAILEDLNETIMPGITHWQHPNFHAYFPANSSVESLLGEMITAAIGAQCMIWDTSPAAAELEERTMTWLREMIGLPEQFEGVIQDSASSATLVAILCARERTTDFSSNEEGVPPNLRVYCSTETHSSIEKAVGVSGIGKNNVCKIPVLEDLSMDVEALRVQIEKDQNSNKVPCCVVASIGTTGTCAVDSIEEIAVICRELGIWLHIDAAYAGSALVLPEYQWMIQGVENADSFVFNAHKWMFTNFDCSAYFVRDVQTLIRTFEVLPEYLKTSSRGIVNDYRDWGVPLGRRFRALKLWFVLRGFGLNTIQSKIREHISLNKFFAAEIDREADFELVMAPFLNLTCFRYLPDKRLSLEEANQINQKLLEELNRSGQLYLSHTKVRGLYALRMVIGQTYIEKRHVVHALKVIKTTASSFSTSIE